MIRVGVQSIAIGGCPGVRDEIWEVLDATSADVGISNGSEGTEAMEVGGVASVEQPGLTLEVEGRSEQELEGCHQLQTLSCVSCKELTICRVGMREALAGGPSAASSSAPVWVPCPTKAAGQASTLLLLQECLS